jgi:putative transposase
MTFDSIPEKSHLYFITASIGGWKHLFADPRYTEIVLGSLDWLRRANRMELYAFIIMPSHLRMISKPIEQTIGDLVQDFGSFTAHSILNRLREDNKEDLLEFFRFERRDARHKHSIWQDIQAKNIFSKDFLRQKLEYIHNNPCAKEWRLVKDRADYRLSSASYYDRGIAPELEIADVRKWL